MKDKAAKLTYLENEWKILEDLSQKKGAKNLRTYINTHMGYLAKCEKEDGNEENIKKSVNYIIPPHISQELFAIAKERKIPLAALIKWYITDPLLREHYQTKRLLLVPPQLVQY